MKRRNFIKLSVLAASSTLLPLDFISKYSYRTPKWSKVASVTAMPNTSLIYQFNMLARYGIDNNGYVRQIACLEAAPNISELDIISEFKLKYNDNDALLTTVGAEDNYYLFESPEQSFRKHLTVGQVKEHIENMRHNQNLHYSMSNYKRIATGNRPRKYRYWIEGETIKTHVVYDDGKENYKEMKLYSIDTFAHEMVSGTKRTQKMESENGAWTKKKYRDSLKQSFLKMV